MSYKGEISFSCVLFEGTNVQGNTSKLYDPSWVNKLYRGVKRNSERDVRFVCITDFEGGFDEGIETIPFLLPNRNYYSILEVLRPELNLGRMIFTGLDTVITGSLEDIYGYDGKHGLISNYPKALLPKRWQECYRRVALCNGVMYTSQDISDYLWAMYKERPDHWEKTSVLPDGSWGSEMCFLYEQAPCEIDTLDYLFPGQILSFKRHIDFKSHWVQKDTEPDCHWSYDDPRIIYFSGSCKPHNYSDHEKLAGHWI